jgi:tetratricopeptide (TPR) repeat protein
MPLSAQATLLDDRYRVLRRLGSGGMASVLLCRDERLGRLVAVKRLHSHQPENVGRRFVREAKLGASLNHPNLVSVYDTATDEEGVLIVMEYVEGEALSQALRRGPLDPTRVGRMAAEVGDALDHAHAHGVVHRDVKPGNVLLRSDGVTKLADLGIASAADQTRITGSGTVLGSASYMAPEQLEGNRAEPPADIYALACVCFEALTGRRARRGRSAMEVAHRIATEPPPDLRAELPAAPAAAGELLRRGMAREPERRPASAGELGRALRRALERTPQATASTRPLESAAGAGGPAGLPLPPRTPATTGGKAPTAAPTRRRRRPGLAALLLAAATLALGAAVIGGVLAAGGDDESPARTEGQRAERPADKAKKQKQKQEKQVETPQAAPAPAEPEPAAPAEEPAEEAPAEEPSATEEPSSAPTDGGALNDQGFALMQQGRYDEAIPILQRAVDSYPAGTTDLTYAYALFNLGRSLRLAGRAAEAVPVLEQRLQIPNQRGVVKRELELARRAAAGG